MESGALSEGFEESLREAGDVAPDIKDAWCTEDDLVEQGYLREALIALFGKATEGPNGIVGWAAASVSKIEESILEPAYALIVNSFQSFDDAETMQARVGYSR